MDPITMQKFQAIKKSKKHQLLESFFLYSLTAITCSLFCSCPFWFPSLCSSMKFFVSVTLPKFSSMLLSTKLLFIIGNLIIVVLIGESKFFASESSPASNVYYDEYVNRSQVLQNPSSPVEKSEEKIEKSLEENMMKRTSPTEELVVVEEEKVKMKKEREKLDGEDEITLPTEELNKRADDLIARVKKQRSLEAILLLYGGE